MSEQLALRCRQLAEMSVATCQEGVTLQGGLQVRSWHHRQPYLSRWQTISEQLGFILGSWLQHL